MSEPASGQLPKRVAVAYLVFQALSALVWWLVITLRPSLRQYFMVPDAPDVTLMAFFGADLMLFIGMSLVSAVLLARSSPKRTAALWLTSGAIGYAGLYTLGLSLATGVAWAAAIPITGAMICTLLIAWTCS